MSPTSDIDTPLPVRAPLDQNEDVHTGESARSIAAEDLELEEAGKVLGTSFKTTRSLLDIDVEDLIKRLHDVEMRDSPANSQKSTIHVPPDYSMQMQIDSQAYQKYRALQRTREQSRAEKRIPLSTSKEKKLQHGFDPVRVMRQHAILLPKKYPFRLPSLENEILPIFKWENFHDCALDVYERLKPALRLSSLLITHRASSVFWHTIAYGDRQTCEKTSKQYSRSCTRIIDDVPWRKTKADELLLYFEGLAEQVHFHFDLLKGASITPTYTYGYCNVIQDYKNPLPSSNGCQKARICLHTDFYTTAKRLSKLNPRNVDAAMVLRFNFFLAVNITHEIAHFVELGHNYPIHLGEVFFNDHTWAECGAVFERKIFGGRIHPISARIDCAYGLATYDWPAYNADGDEESIHWTIPMTYIANIQQASTWDNATEAADFHIPRTGARSVGLCALDLTMWEEGDVNIVDDKSLDGFNIPWRRLLNGSIVRNNGNGNVLRGTKTGRVVKSNPKKASTGGRSKNAAIPTGRRPFRLSKHKRAIKKVVPKNRLPVEKKKKKGKAPPSKKS